MYSLKIKKYVHYVNFCAKLTDYAAAVDVYLKKIYSTTSLSCELLSKRTYALFFCLKLIFIFIKYIKKIIKQLILVRH